MAEQLDDELVVPTVEAGEVERSPPEHGNVGRPMVLPVAPHRSASVHARSPRAAPARASSRVGGDELAERGIECDRSSMWNSSENVSARDAVLGPQEPLQELELGAAGHLQKCCPLTAAARKAFMRISIGGVPGAFSL